MVAEAGWVGDDVGSGAGAAEHPASESTSAAAIGAAHFQVTRPLYRCRDGAPAVIDGETRTEADVHFLPVSEFDPSTAFTPAYEEKNLKVGECNEGWISVDHGNPDLAWASVRYQPADFGDVVIWDLGS